MSQLLTYAERPSDADMIGRWQTLVLNGMDNEGFTPLMTACKFGHDAGVVRLLLNAKADAKASSAAVVKLAS